MCVCARTRVTGKGSLRNGLATFSLLGEFALGEKFLKFLNFFLQQQQQQQLNNYKHEMLTLAGLLPHGQSSEELCVCVCVCMKAPAPPAGDSVPLQRNSLTSEPQD